MRRCDNQHTLSKIRNCWYIFRFTIDFSYFWFLAWTVRGSDSSAFAGCQLWSLCLWRYSFLLGKGYEMVINVVKYSTIFKTIQPPDHFKIKISWKSFYVNWKMCQKLRLCQLLLYLFHSFRFFFQKFFIYPNRSSINKLCVL